MNSVFASLRIVLCATILASGILAGPALSQTITVAPEAPLGSSLTLTIDAGLPNTRYWLEVSAAGTSPGVPTATGRILPLNRPWIHSDMRTMLPQGFFTGFEGITDAFGYATAVLQIPTTPSLAGLLMHAGFVTEDATRTDGIGLISHPVPFRLVAAPTSESWDVRWPADIPASHRPALPNPPQTQTVVQLSGSGNHNISVSDRIYRLTGDVGRIGIASGTSRIVIDGQGHRAAGILLPSVWPIPGSPSVSDVVIRNIQLTGGSSGNAIEGACRRLLLQSVSNPRDSVPNYCIYTRFSEDLVIEGCDFQTLGQEACVRLVDVQRFAGFRCDFDSGMKHAFRIHFSSSHIWLSDTTCGKPLYLGYEESGILGRPPEDLRHVILRRVHVWPQAGGNIMQVAHPSTLNPLEMSDCTFHADGNLTHAQVNSFRNTADSVSHWTYRNLDVR